MAIMVVNSRTDWTETYPPALDRRYLVYLPYRNRSCHRLDSGAIVQYSLGCRL